MATTTVTVEVEFVAGTWTNVTPDVDFGAGISVTVGRSSPQQAPVTSSMSLSLRNPTGKYTPGLQVLSDGSAAPYYPNVIPRRRIRFRNSSGTRWLGFVQSWAPLLDNGVLGRCQVQAVDRLDQLSRVVMNPPISTEIMVDRPDGYYPLTDASGSTSAVEVTGNAITSALSIMGTTTTFGDNGPGFGDGTGVRFAPTSAASTQGLAGTFAFGQGLGTLQWTFEIWVNVGLGPPPWGGSMEVAQFNLDTYSTQSGYFLLSVSGVTGRVLASGSVGGPITGTTSLFDGGWHHIVCTLGSALFSLYVDGSLQAVTGTSGGFYANLFVIGNLIAGGLPLLGNIGQVAIYSTTLSAARIATHYSAGRGYYGELVSDRIKRFLGIAGLTSTDWSIDTSSVACNTYPQGGKDVQSACQDMTITEGSGSAFYVLGGQVRFTNRNFRIPTTPALTLDADTMLNRGVFSPSSDSQSLINSATVQRSGESGTLASWTVTDAASVATNGIYTGPDVTTYTTTDADALNLAQQIVAGNRNPAYRLPQISVDLLTAASSLYAGLQNVEIGDRIRITNLPAAAAPASQIDVIVEGWTENVTKDQYLVTFDTSPADNPAMAVYDTDRYQTEGHTLSASITSASTSIAIVTPGGAPTFTTTSADYPLSIQLDAEIITLPNAPGGSTSPQTFTGAQRARLGTAAAAHTSGSTVQLAPLATYAL